MAAQEATRFEPLATKMLQSALALSEKPLPLLASATSSFAIRLLDQPPSDLLPLLGSSILPADPVRCLTRHFQFRNGLTPSRTLTFSSSSQSWNHSSSSSEGKHAFSRFAPDPDSLRSYQRDPTAGEAWQELAKSALVAVFDRSDSSAAMSGSFVELLGRAELCG